MQEITKKFTSNTSMEINDDVIKVFEFIASPDSVYQMIKSTEIGDPALTGIVHELEARFADCEGFPLNHELNRRNVGWMIKFVMREYGYTTIKNSERTRIPKKTGSVYFKNAAVYHLTNSNSDYKMIPLTGVLYTRSLTTEDLYIKEDDPDYEQILKGVSDINKRRRELRLNEEFVSAFLNNLGFRGMISVEDVWLMFDGIKVPGQELYDALNRMIAFFNMPNYQKENEKGTTMKLESDFTSDTKIYFEHKKTSGD